jgi:uncharacterized protein (DUF433 family)
MVVSQRQPQLLFKRIQFFGESIGASRESAVTLSLGQIITFHEAGLGRMWYNTLNQSLYGRGIVTRNRAIPMLGFDRITFDSNVMGGRACIRGMRITVSLIVNLVANGMSTEEIIEAYPYLEPDDVRQALEYAAWLAEETIHSLEPAGAAFAIASPAIDLRSADK